jgi:hypothetical protein
MGLLKPGYAGKPLIGVGGATLANNGNGFLIPVWRAQRLSRPSKSKPCARSAKLISDSPPG